MAEVVLKNLLKSFAPSGDTTQSLVLKDLSLTVRDGEFFFLLGPSGCGKTTLLRLIAGLLVPDSGSISIDGENMRDVPAHKRGLAMVFQNYALWPHMTVEQNVAFGLEMAKVSEPEREVRVGEALLAARIAELAQRFPQELSGGQQQRVALARALAVRPRVLLLDEPLSNLDAMLRVEMRRELRALHERTKMTMIYVTHDQSEALALGSTIAVLNAGRIEQVGTAKELLSAPATDFMRGFLSGIQLLRGKPLTTPNGPTLAITGEIPLANDTDGHPLQSECTLAIRQESIVPIIW